MTVIQEMVAVQELEAIQETATVQEMKVIQKTKEMQETKEMDETKTIQETREDVRIKAAKLPAMLMGTYVSTDFAQHDTPSWIYAYTNDMEETTSSSDVLPLLKLSDPGSSRQIFSILDNDTQITFVNNIFSNRSLCQKRKVSGGRGGIQAMQ